MLRVLRFSIKSISKQNTDSVSHMIYVFIQDTDTGTSRRVSMKSLIRNADNIDGVKRVSDNVIQLTCEFDGVQRLLILRKTKDGSYEPTLSLPDDYVVSTESCGCCSCKLVGDTITLRNISGDVAESDRLWFEKLIRQTVTNPLNQNNLNVFADRRLITL